MMEAFILSFFMCTANPMGFEDCSVQVGTAVHETEQSCVVEALESALPWAAQNGFVIHDFNCGPYTVPFGPGEPT